MSLPWQPPSVRTVPVRTNILFLRAINCPVQFRSASSSTGKRLLGQSRPSVHDVDGVIEGENVSRESFKAIDCFLLCCRLREAAFVNLNAATPTDPARYESGKKPISEFGLEVLPVPRAEVPRRQASCHRGQRCLWRVCTWRTPTPW